MSDEEGMYPEGPDEIDESTSELSPSSIQRGHERAAGIRSLVWRPPEAFAQYRRIRPLGSGGMGSVYLYNDIRIGREVAIKFVREQDRRLADRLSREARAIGKCRHPNVVVVHAIDELDGWPYIVYEYLDGKSLARQLPIRPMRLLLTRAQDIARGLAAVHSHGIVHGDIKPSNIMLDKESEGVKLIDFGLARRPGQAETEDEGELPARRGAGSDRHQRIAGTAGYMAPEMWKAGGATPQSDVYAFGVTLHELCTGRLPGHGRDGHTPEQVTQTSQPAPRHPTRNELFDSIPGLEPILQKCLEIEPEERYPSAEPLLEALSALSIASEVRRPGECPYRGLRPFESQHRELFFGRDREIADILEGLRARRFTVLAGGSGVGKSSLVRAGVLPMLSELERHTGRQWSALTIQPGAHPVRILCAALTGYLGSHADSALAALPRGDVVGVERALLDHHGQGAGLLLFIDQLEELSTQANAGEVAILDDLLTHLIATSTPAIRILATARRDYLDRLAEVLPGLAEHFSGAMQFVYPLTEPRLREVITWPARAHGVSFESELLVDHLVDTMKTSRGGLPLLQFALAALWSSRDGERQVITQAALEQLGGLQGALARHADEVMDGILATGLREAARRILLQLVTVKNTRARRTPSDLELDDPDCRLALEALIKGRLVVAEAADIDEEPIYELAHDALISNWPRLQHWLTEHGESRILLARVQRAADQWELNGRDPADLWDADRLRTLHGVDPSDIRSEVREFMDTSRVTVRRQRRFRAVMVALVAITLTGVGIGTYAWTVHQESQQRAREVDALVSEANAAWVRAREERREYASALQQMADSLTANGSQVIARSVVQQALAHWRRALSLEHQIERSYQEAARLAENAYSHAPGHGASRGLLADVLDDMASFAFRRGLHEQWESLLGRLQIHDPARYRAWRREVPVRIEHEPDVTVAIEHDLGSSRQIIDRQRRAVAGGVFEIELPPGSYVLRAAGDRRRVEVRRPVWIAPRSQARTIHIARPARNERLDAYGMVYIPSGEFPFGWARGQAGELLRIWFETMPLHLRRVDAFWIARHETTYAEWIAYLEACYPADCPDARPQPGGDKAGYRIELLDHGGEGDARWELVIRPGEDREYRALQGRELVYEERTGPTARVDWQRLPVTAISPEQVRAYLAWLDRTGRLPGARLCRSDEWERAVRGADGRRFPHGDVLRPGEANIDTTYGRRSGAMGPDEVGYRAHSASPFAILDMAGNVFEMTEPLTEVEQAGAVYLRGGSFYQPEMDAMAANQWYLQPDQRTPRNGFRVCVSTTSPGR